MDVDADVGSLGSTNTTITSRSKSKFLAKKLMTQNCYCYERALLELELHFSISSHKRFSHQNCDGSKGIPGL